MNTDDGSKAGAAAVDQAARRQDGDRPSIIIVEVLGYGGGNGEEDIERPEERQRERTQDQRTYDTNSVLQLVGNGPLTDAQKRALTEEERKNLGAQ